MSLTEQDAVQPASKSEVSNKNFATARQKVIATSLPRKWIVYSLFWVGFFFVLSKKISDAIRLRRDLQNAFTLHRRGSLRVKISDDFQIPFSARILGAAYVVMPTSLLRSKSDFRISLKHELEHHRQGDCAWTFWFEFLVAAFFWNPAIYLWRRTFSQLQELACDETLIGQMRISQQDYGSCLIRVAEAALIGRGLHGGTTCMISPTECKSRSFLARRIKMFTHHAQASRKRRFLTPIGILSLSALIAGAFVAQAALKNSKAPNPGKPEYLQPIQALVNEKLDQGITRYNASAGLAIVADAKRGTLLSVVGINKGFDKAMVGDWPLSYPLAPASAIKPIIVAGALQERKTTPDELHNCEKGSYKYGDTTFHDYKAFDFLSTTDTIAASSNICALKISQTLGPKGVQRALQNFGFGGNGALENFPSAGYGHLPSPDGFSDPEYLGSITLGSSEKTNFYITPAELISAYVILANGGKMMKAISYKQSGSPVELREVISSSVASKVRKMLSQVVESGTASNLKGGEVSVAGKTSTGQAKSGQWVTSFIGYAPAENPSVVTYVVLFDPKGKAVTGSSTAAYVFEDIVESVIPELGL
ncbi:MAG: hypothetical protein KDD22_08785 [Bdellovibrionales bacterium]|nr:hypothetical protein [Bdellovibrionales bacterium]